MALLCSNCGVSKAMYCAQCMHKLQARVKELETELADLKEVMEACMYSEGYCYNSTEGNKTEG